MPSIAEVFMRIHVDSGTVKRDVEDGLRKVDVKTQGDIAGREYGNSFGRSAVNQINNALRKISGPGSGGISGKGLGIGALGSLGLAASPALLAAGGAAGTLAGGIGLGALGAKTLLSQGGALQAQGATVAKAFSDQWNKAVLGMAPALGKALAGLPRLFQQLEPALQAAFQGVGALIQPLVTGLGSLAKVLLPAFGQALRIVGPFLTPLLNGFTSLVVGILPGLLGLLKLAGPAVSAVGVVLGVLGRAIGTILGGLGPGVKAASVLLVAVSQIIGALAPVVAALAVKLAVALAPAFVAIARGLVALTPSLIKLVGLLGPVLVGAVNLAVIGLTAIIGAFTRLPAPVKLAALAIIAVGLALKLAAAANPWILLITATIIAVGLIVRYWKPISGFFVGIWHTIHDDFVAPIVNFFTKTIPNAFSTAIGAIRRTLGTWAPILATLLLGPVAGAVVFIVTHWNTVKNTTAAIWNAIGRFFSGIWAAIGRVFNSSVAYCMRVVSAQWTAIQRVSSAIWSGISRFFSSIWGAIGRVFSSSTAFCGRVASAAWTAISRTTASIWNAIGRFFSSIWGAIGRLFSSSTGYLGRTLSNAWNNIFNDVKSVFGGIGRWFNGWWGDTERFIANIAGNTIRNALSGAWRNIASDAKILWKAIGGWFASGINDGIGALDNVINFITQKVLNPLITGYNAVNDIWSGTDITFRFPVLHAPGHAAGGKITDGTHETADDVLIRVSRGETVLSGAHTRVLERAGVLGALGVPGFATGGQILTDATKYNHHRYVWGGASNPQTGWDCSSFAGYILGHDFSYPLPGGVHWNGSVHGPTANEFVHQPGFKMVSHNIKDILPGDLLVENSGGHVGFGVGPNQMFSAYDTASGTIFSNAANMTNILRSDGGPGQYNGPGGTISAALQKKYNAYQALLGTDIKLYSPSALVRAFTKNPAALPKGVLTAKGAANYNLMGGNYASQIKPAVTSAYNAAVAALAAQGTPGGDPAGGATGSELQNGKELYNYLLKNLFGGNKIAAAGAIASIWGESTWNPFAQGTGGRGLIGWTPPGTISEAAFRGGMATQEPAILQFVTRNGDSGVIAEMFRATSVLEAANLWGKGVERFGINDVHSTGLNLAKQIAGLKNGGRVGKRMARGGMISEPMIGIGASGQMIELGENGRERVLPGDGSDPMLSALHAILAALRVAPAKTAAGVAAAVKAPQATMSQAARAGAR